MMEWAGEKTGGPASVLTYTRHLGIKGNDGGSSASKLRLAARCVIEHDKGDTGYYTGLLGQGDVAYLRRHAVHTESIWDFIPSVTCR